MNKNQGQYSPSPEGGIMPDLDFLKQIRETEQQAADRVSQAVENARISQEDARRQAADVLRQAREEAARLVENGLTEAEAQARKLLQAADERSAAESSERTQVSAPQLEKAAALIVERIVSDYVHR
jgi:V/A-type H+/Na+-transporting ATPase subunit G/H